MQLQPLAAATVINLRLSAIQDGAKA